MLGQGVDNPDRVHPPEPVTNVPSENDEPTKEEILEGIRIGIRQALAGETTPIEQLFEEVGREMENDADAGSNQ